MIPVEVKEKCIALKAEGMAVREIYSDYFLANTDSTAKFESFQRKLNQWVTKYGGDVALLPEGFKPTRGTFHIKDGYVKESWLRAKDEERDWHSEILEAIENFDPINTAVKRYPHQGTRTMLEIPLFDMHLGISDYEYYEYVQYQVAEEIQKGHSKVLFAIGSDLFHNNDHRGRTAKGTPVDHVDMCKAFDDALSFYVPLLRLADKHADEVEVIYVKGNHDESPSWYFVKHLSAIFPTFNYNFDFEEKKVTVWEDIFIGFTHGDKGQKAIPEVFIEEWAIPWAHAKVREIHTGHLHVLKERDSYGTQIRTLPTGGKTDQWSKDGSFQGAIKKFKIFVYGVDRILAEYPIYQR